MTVTEFQAQSPRRYMRMNGGAAVTVLTVLVIGLLITIIVLRGGFAILKDAKAESAKPSH